MHIIDEKVSKLKDTSIDKENNEYMVECSLNVCDFDKVKEWYIENKVPLVTPNPKSNDALFFDDDESYFMEFKNGKIDNGVNYEIIKKIYDSLFILFDLKYFDRNGDCVDSISYTRSRMNYILIYNEQKYAEAGPTRQTKEGFTRQKERNSHSPSRDLLYKGVAKLAKDELIKFGLDQFKNYFFKNVHTYTVKEFEKYILKDKLGC